MSHGYTRLREYFFSRERSTRVEGQKRSIYAKENIVEKKDTGGDDSQESHLKSGLTSSAKANLAIVQERLGMDEGGVNLALDTPYAKEAQGYPHKDRTRA